MFANMYGPSGLQSDKSHVIFVIWSHQTNLMNMILKRFFQIHNVKIDAFLWTAYKIALHNKYT